MKVFLTVLEDCGGDRYQDLEISLIPGTYSQVYSRTAQAIIQRRLPGCLLQLAVFEKQRLERKL